MSFLTRYSHANVIVYVAVFTILFMLAIGMFVMRQHDVNSFEACVASGGPVTKSDPPQCQIDGKVYFKL